MLSLLSKLNNAKYIAKVLNRSTNTSANFQNTFKYRAKAPTTVKFNNPVYKDVTYEITGFDKEFSEVKSDLTKSLMTLFVAEFTAIGEDHRTLSFSSDARMPFTTDNNSSLGTSFK